MKSKKGLYLLITLIGTIFIFFFILFFVHENTLENGVLFTVSFEYENAKDIEYNFYNQNGKIEKIEGENKFLLEKTDYNAVKLLRKITKKIKETKTPKEEEGITIYNGQNKRYYLIPFESEAASELTSYILDGYIRSELKRKANKSLGTEIYLYQENEKLLSTKDGNKDNIIHTYRCNSADCRMIETEYSFAETVLWDENYYYYNYVTRVKEQIYVEKDFEKSDFIKLDNHIKGLQLQNIKKENAYYSLEKKELITEFENYEYQLVTSDLLLKQKQIKKENSYQQELILMKIQEKNEIWKKEIPVEENTQITITLINPEKNYYLIEKKQKEKTTYQVLDEFGKEMFDGKNVILTDNQEFMIQMENKNYFYNINGEFLREEE